MKTKGLLLLLLFASALTFGARKVWGERGAAFEPAVTQRIITIEGTVEKPRVLFIVSRSRLWKGDSLEKSFVRDILEPVDHEPISRHGEIAPRRR